jgi:hypothetical protein
MQYSAIIVVNKYFKMANAAALAVLIAAGVLGANLIQFRFDVHASGKRNMFMRSQYDSRLK